MLNITILDSNNEAVKEVNTNLAKLYRIKEVSELLSIFKEVSDELDKLAKCGKHFATICFKNESGEPASMVVPLNSKMSDMIMVEAFAVLFRKMRFSKDGLKKMDLFKADRRVVGYPVYLLGTHGASISGQLIFRCWELDLEAGNENPEVIVVDNLETSDDNTLETALMSFISTPRGADYDEMPNIMLGHFASLEYTNSDGKILFYKEVRDTSEIDQMYAELIMAIFREEVE